MISRIRIANLKAFGAEQEVKLAPITLIYGPNSAGKTTLIESLLLLRQSTSETAGRWGLRTRGEDADLGAYRNLIFRHQEHLPLILDVEMDLIDAAGTKGFPKGQRCGIRMEFRHEPDEAARKRFGSDCTLYSVVYDRPQAADEGHIGGSMRLERRRATKSFPGPSYRVARTEFLDRLAKRVADRAARQEASDADGGPTSVDEWREALRSFHIVGSGTFLPDSIRKPRGEKRAVALIPARDVLDDELDDMSLSFLVAMFRCSRIGPLREAPRRVLHMSGGARRTVGSRGEDCFQVILDRDEEELEETNVWLARFGLDYALNVLRMGVEQGIAEAHVGALTIPATEGLPEIMVTLADVGFGVSQLLPIIVEAVAGQQATVLVEQPEIHLNPKQQAEIAQLLAHTADLGDRSKLQEDWHVAKQWIVETHSEMIVRRIQTLVAQGELRPEDVSVVYVDPCPASGAVVRHLAMDENGDFESEWPRGFFDEGYEEMQRRWGQE